METFAELDAGVIDAALPTRPRTDSGMVARRAWCGMVARCARCGMVGHASHPANRRSATRPAGHESSSTRHADKVGDRIPARGAGDDMEEEYPFAIHDFFLELLSVNVPTLGWRRSADIA